jgi:hypothetical protein
MVGDAGERGHRSFLEPGALHPHHELPLTPIRNDFTAINRRTRCHPVVNSPVADRSPCVGKRCQAVRGHAVPGRRVRIFFTCIKRCADTRCPDGA